MARAHPTVRRLGVPLIAALFASPPLAAHRLDALLQLTQISLEKERVHLQLRLIPGIAIADATFAELDADHDGQLSEAERRAYALRALARLTLSLDGVPRPLALERIDVPSLDELRTGAGEITIEAGADGRSASARRHLVLETRREAGLSVMVNALVPGDPELRLEAQQRSPDQARYELDYLSSATAAAGLTAPGPALLLALIALLGAAAGFSLLARQGRRASSPNLQAANAAVKQAQAKISTAPTANELDMEGHAAKAKELLDQAATELKAAAEAATANKK